METSWSALVALPLVILHCDFAIVSVKHVLVAPRLILCPIRIPF